MTPSSTAPFVARASRIRWLAPALAAAVLLSACGDDADDESPLPFPSPGTGTILASAQSAQKCSSSNPYRGDSAVGANPPAGTLEDEKRWVRAYLNESYLWYSQVPTVDAAAAAYSDTANVYPSLDGYFSALTTLPQDRFSFTYPTKQWNDLSQSGVSLGYGMEFYRASPTPPRGYRIAYVEPGSPAAAAGLRRGDALVSVDGVSGDDNTASGVDAFNAGLNPSGASSHSFAFSRNGTALAPVTLTAGPIALDPVPVARVHTVGTARIGYLLFNDHVLTAEAKLIDAMRGFQTAGIDDLVVDLRYNRGGYLFLASQLAYMVAGSSATAGKTFERLQYNAKRTADNNESPTPFFNTSCLPDASFNCRNTGALPTLNLRRVWVLTARNTCSASEAFVNSLRGIDIDVRTIGGTTCGKPFGFTAKDNCGISYFPIEFKGVNNKGFGDYESGFSANCSAADDFSRELGDVSEGQFQAAVANRATGSCSTAFGSAKSGLGQGLLIERPERGHKIHQHFEGLR